MWRDIYFENKNFFVKFRYLKFTVFILSVNIEIVTPFPISLLIFCCGVSGQAHGARCLRNGKKV